MFANIENYYEHLVFERIRETLEGEDEIAFLEDIACVALNRLPPRYARHAVDLADHLSDEEWEELNRQVDEAVTYAIQFAQRRHSERAGESD